MKKLSLFIIASMVLSCGQIAPGNANLKIIEDKAGETIKLKDFISITFTEEAEDGAQLGGSAEYDDRPLLLSRRPSYFKGDFFEMLGYLSEGDSAHFKVSIDSISQKMGKELPAGITGKYLIYKIRVNKVISWAGKTTRNYDSAVEAYSNKAFNVEKQRESQKIGNYLLKHKLAYKRFTSGVMYRVIQPGNGPLPANGDSVVINYTGETLKGKVFETSEASVARKNGIYQPLAVYKPYSTRIIDGQKESIFKKTLRMFAKGAKVTLVFPSKDAYGENAYKMLGPYTPVICRLEILDVIKQR